MSPETKQLMIAFSKEGRAWAELALKNAPALAGFFAGLHLPMPTYMKKLLDFIRGLFNRKKPLADGEKNA